MTDLPPQNPATVPVSQVPPTIPPSVPPTAPLGGGGGGPTGGGGGGGNGGLVAAIVVVLVLIAGVGGFLLVSGGDDDDDGREVATRDDDEGDDESSTTTTTEGGTTTTTAAPTTTTAAPTTTTGGATTTTAAGGLTFTQITDDSGTLVVEVPDTWTEVDGRPLGDGAYNVQASSSLDGFRNPAQNEPASGLSYTLLNESNVDPDATIDFLIQGQSGCTTQPRVDYDDQVFVGRAQELSNCGGLGISLIVIVASNPQGQSVEVSTRIVPPDDLNAIVGQIVRTFNLRT